MIYFLTDVQGEAEKESIGDEEDGEDNDCAEEERFVAILQPHHL